MIAPTASNSSTTMMLDPTPDRQAFLTSFLHTCTPSDLYFISRTLPSLFSTVSSPPPSPFSLPSPILLPLNQLQPPQHDFLSRLPAELTLYILELTSYVDPWALVRAEAVCKRWRQLVRGEEGLWRRVCDVWGFGGPALALTSTASASGGRLRSGDGWYKSGPPPAPPPKSIQIPGDEEPLEEMEPYADLPMDAALEWIAARKRRAKSESGHSSTTATMNARASVVEKAKRSCDLDTLATYRQHFRECCIKLIHWERGGRLMRSHRLPMLFGPSQHQYSNPSSSNSRGWGAGREDDPTYMPSFTTASHHHQHHTKQQSESGSNGSGVVTSLALDPDWIVVGLASSRIHVFSTKTGVLARTLVGHESGVWGVCLISAGGGARTGGKREGKRKKGAMDAENDTFDLGNTNIGADADVMHRGKSTIKTVDIVDMGEESHLEGFTSGISRSAVASLSTSTLPSSSSSSSYTSKSGPRSSSRSSSSSISLPASSPSPSTNKHQNKDQDGEKEMTASKFSDGKNTPEMEVYVESEHSTEGNWSETETEEMTDRDVNGLGEGLYRSLPLALRVAVGLGGGLDGVDDGERGGGSGIDKGKGREGIFARAEEDAYTVADVDMEEFYHRKSPSEPSPSSSSTPSASFSSSRRDKKRDKEPSAGSSQSRTSPQTRENANASTSESGNPNHQRQERTQRQHLHHHQRQHYKPQRQSDPCFASEGWGQPNSLVVSGGCDKVVRVWDVRSGHCIYALPGHTSTIRCMRTLHGRPIAVTGSRDGTIRTWDIQRGRALRVLQGHTGSVRCLDVNGSRAASGSYDATCRIWDLDTGECLFVLRGHYHQVYAVSFDGELVATGGLDTSVRVWDAKTGHCLALLQGHTALVSDVRLSRKHQILVTGGSDGRVITFSLVSFDSEDIDGSESSMVVPTLSSDRPGTEKLSWRGKKRQKELVTTGLDKLRMQESEGVLWDRSRSRSVRIPKLPSLFFTKEGGGGSGGAGAPTYPALRAATDISSSPSSPFQQYQQYRDYNRHRIAFEPLHRLSAHTSSVTALQFDGRYLVTAGYDGSVHLWETQTGRFVRKMTEDGEKIWKVGFTSSASASTRRSCRDRVNRDASGHGNEQDEEDGVSEGEESESEEEPIGDVCVIVGQRGVKTVLEVWKFGE